MGKSASQKRETARVQKRLTESGPIRLDVESTTSGKSGGAKEATKKTAYEVHPSLESATQRMDDLGVNQGTVTTSDGLQVRVSRANTNKAAGFQPQSLETSETRKGQAPHPPLKEGVSQRFEQRIGHEHGEEKAAALTAEADEVAARPNPLRSDGLVDRMVQMFAPSMGGNRRGHGGRLSALARDDDAVLPQSKVARSAPSAETAAKFPELARGPVFSGTKDMALNMLGYGDDVQTKLFGDAKEAIAKRQATRRRDVPALSESEISARAYGQVNERLDEALHGTKPDNKEPTDSDVTLINELADQVAGGSHGYDVRRNSPGEGGGLPPTRAEAPTGRRPGMTQSRTPQQEAMRKGVRALVRQRGGWSALRGPAVAEAANNDLKEITLRQEARRAQAVAPEERNTMSPDADPERASRRHAQLVVSTGPAVPFKDTSPGPGVGVASEPDKKVLPARPREGAIDPLPPNLPTEPARLGRTRAERGLSDIRDSRREMRGGLAPLPKDYSGAVAGYIESRPELSPKNSGKPRSLGAPQDNVKVAQTAVVKTKSVAEKRAEQRARL